MNMSFSISPSLVASIPSCVSSFYKIKQVHAHDITPCCKNDRKETILGRINCTVWLAKEQNKAIHYAEGCKQMTS